MGIREVEKAREEIIVLTMETSEELSQKDIEKLHHYWGHCSVEKLEILIKNSGSMNEGVKKHLESVKKECEACKVITNRRPRQILQCQEPQEKEPDCQHEPQGI